MTPIYRARLADHLTRRLSPVAQQTAREMRRALYPALSDSELRSEYVAVAAARNACLDARRGFLCELADDLENVLVMRGVRFLWAREETAA